MALPIFLLFLGIGLLYLGSEWMVRGAASLALAACIRPLIVGLTVVAFATSAPELLVSLVAAYRGSSGVSLGNILGSNVANIGLVLGASSLIRPLSIQRSLLRCEIPFMIGASGLFWLVCLDGEIGRADGVLLLAGLASFLIIGVWTARNQLAPKLEGIEKTRKKVLWHLLCLVMGTAGLIAGANLTVKSALFIADQIGLSELFVGLTVVAVGTSLPELATSVVASARGEHDLSIGNVVGSNVFNIGMVIGTVGLFCPMSVNMELMVFEFPVMLFLSVALFIFSRTGFVLNRFEGLFFVVCFILFLGVSYDRAAG